MCPSRLFAVLSALLLASATASAAEPPKIGDRVGKLKFTDIRSLPRTLDDFGTKKAFVLVFTNTTCPLAQRYLPTLQALEKEYRGKGRAVRRRQRGRGRHAHRDGDAGGAARHGVPLRQGLRRRLRQALGVKRTPEAVVLDAREASALSRPDRRPVSPRRRSQGADAAAI